ncbi:MAG: hypothetical protein ACXVCG_10240, partial [Bdellovibrionota bacterium]
GSCPPPFRLRLQGAELKLRMQKGPPGLFVNPLTSLAGGVLLVFPSGTLFFSPPIPHARMALGAKDYVCGMGGEKMG